MCLISAHSRLIVPKRGKDGNVDVQPRQLLANCPVITICDATYRLNFTSQHLESIAPSVHLLRQLHRSGTRRAPLVPLLEGIHTTLSQ